MQIPRWLFWRLPLFKAVAYATIQIYCQGAIAKITNEVFALLLVEVFVTMTHHFAKH